ncbi:MAG: HpcH/HpaI aldolase/citrate lyase family protein [Sphaerochaetaceae bacterium]
MKTTKEKLRACEKVMGMHVLLADPCISELCGKLGFDFLWIDTEHTAIDYHILITHLMGAAASGCDSIVRVPWNDAVLAKRVLEQGPTGILFPMISTPEELDSAMKSTLYPPLGNRGFGPIRAVDYGIMDQEEYIHHITLEKMIRMVQIETKTGVDNLEEMCKNPWVDCFMIGPCDLSASIGHLYKIYEKPTTDLIRLAARKCRDAGKSIGISIATEDPQQIRFWYDMGLNVISCGSDTSHIVNGARRTLEHLKAL